MKSCELSKAEINIYWNQTQKGILTLNISTFTATFFLFLSTQQLTEQKLIIESAIQNKEGQQDIILGQSVKVVFTNVKTETGKIWISICLEKQLWNNGDNICTYRTRIPAKEGATHTFSNIPAGTYAITAFHDENNNERLDFDTLGIPFEPTGVSRNAVGNYGPPSFDDIKFIINSRTNDSVLTMNIVMRRNGSN